MKKDYLPAIHKSRAIHHNILHPTLTPPCTLLHSSPGIPSRSLEEATGAPQLWLELLRSASPQKCGYVRGRPPALCGAREPSISAPAERARTGRRGEWRTRKPLPRDAFYPPTSCLHRRMDDALRGRVALVQFFFLLLLLLLLSVCMWSPFCPILGPCWGPWHLASWGHDGVKMAKVWTYVSGAQGS